MRIAIIGGSAFSTPELIRFLDKNKALGQMEVVLASRSRQRSEAVKRASMLSGADDIQICVEQITQTTWARILEGADCILIQMRVGGYAGREFDETFPHKYGLCGDEGLGVAGLSVGLRTWPVLAEILQQIVELCPRAFVILMTSPLSLLVRASYKTTELNLVGICELPWTTLRRLRQSILPAHGDLEASYLGVNHLGWFFNFHAGPRSLDNEVAESTSEESFPSCNFLRTHRCFPTRYLRMHYEPEKVLGEQLSQRRSRAQELTELQATAYNAYSFGSATDVAGILKSRQAPWYSHAIGPLLVALGGHPTAIPFFLSVPNGSYTDLLQPDDILECRHHWVDGSLKRTALAGPTPAHLAETLPPLVAFERIATEAIMTRRLPVLVEALSLHPWTQGHPQLQAMACEIATYNDVMAVA